MPDEQRGALQFDRPTKAGTANSLDRAIVVTGASTGIGRAIVAKAVREGSHVFASVRGQTDAIDLLQEFGQSVTPLLFDVTDEAGVRSGAMQVCQMLGERRLFGLINNAGIAVSGPLLHISTEELQRQFDVNVLGVHRVTTAFAPLLGVDPDRIGKSGRIVMISSEGGQRGMPFVGPYSASKFALEGYSQSLRRELMLYDIDVIVVGPGAIATPIWDKALKDDLSRFGQTNYGPSAQKVSDYMVQQGRDGLPANVVADRVWQALTAKNPKTRYSILRNALVDRTLANLLPPRVVDNVVAQRLGFPKR
jgi:NAD(P)-dependent dehydrogenase (short-subunit alcohol dehydrogenase family)